MVRFLSFLIFVLGISACNAEFSNKISVANPEIARTSAPMVIDFISLTGGGTALVVAPADNTRYCSTTNSGFEERSLSNRVIATYSGITCMYLSSGESRIIKNVSNTTANTISVSTGSSYYPISSSGGGGLLLATQVDWNANSAITATSPALVQANVPTLSGSNNLLGTNTFMGNVFVPTPSQVSSATNKFYVDSAINPIQTTLNNIQTYLTTTGIAATMALSNATGGTLTTTAQQLLTAAVVQTPSSNIGSLDFDNINKQFAINSYGNFSLNIFSNIAALESFTTLTLQFRKSDGTTILSSANVNIVPSATQTSIFVNVNINSSNFPSLPATIQLWGFDSTGSTLYDNVVFTAILAGSQSNANNSSQIANLSSVAGTNVTGALNTLLSTKAASNNVVDLTSAQNINAYKTFLVGSGSSQSPINPQDYTNKAYVDARTGGTSNPFAGYYVISILQQAFPNYVRNSVVLQYNTSANSFQCSGFQAMSMYISGQLISTGASENSNQVNMCSGKGVSATFTTPSQFTEYSQMFVNVNFTGSSNVATAGFKMPINFQASGTASFREIASFLTTAYLPQGLKNITIDETKLVR